MSDTPRSTDAATGLPTLIPPQVRDDGDDGHHDRDGVDVTPEAHKPAEQLGFQMRFEAGKALLALDDRAAEDGVVVRRALFEVPDVAFPLDVSGGALRFQNKRLTLRAVELAVTWDALFVEGDLARHGMSLVRERSRAGGLELIVALEGTAGPVPIRARCIFAPVGDGGVALVLHELLGFLPLPRRRLELAPALLDALRFPGGLPARAMIRRAEPFRAVFSRLLPLYGWKVPSLGDVRVHEAVLGKGEVVLRAWSGQPPEGWKAPRPQKKGPLQDAISLAVFADGLVAAGDDAARIKLIDRLIDEGALSSSSVPFSAELLRADPRRRADGDDLIVRALKDDDEHLGLLSAWAEAIDISGAERARRLMKLSAAADANDEPWVAGRAAIGAARLADAEGDVDLALEAASAAVEADPSVAEAGMFLSRLLAHKGELERALATGRAALERAGSGSLIEPAADLDAADTFAIELAATAKVVEGHDAARLLLRRALRQRERADALVPLVELEIDAGSLERAAEGLARLLVVIDREPGLKKHVELLAARIAEERGDRETARAHLLAARDLDPKDARVALRLARLAEDAGDLDRAAEALAVVVGDSVAEDDVDDRELSADERGALAAARFAAARLSLKRAWRGGTGARAAAERTRGLLARLPAPRRAEAEVVRIDAEARAVLGDSAPLGELLLQDAANAQDRKVGNALRVDAAKHLLDAAAVDAAAAALADAFVDGDAAAADVVVERVTMAGLVMAFGRSVLGRRPDDAVVTDAVQQLARRLAGAGRPGDAFNVLDGRVDRVSRELRAGSARDNNDLDAEISERQALVGLVDADKRGAQFVRLAVLLQRRERFGDAADAWASAALLADNANNAEVGGAGDSAAVDVAAWQQAAVQSADPARVALVIVRDDADITSLDSALLRAAIEPVVDAADRRRLLASLASRNHEVGDVERWLDAARQLPAREAAVAFIDAARRNQRPDWLFEGLDLHVSAGDTALALQAITAIVDDVDGAGAAAANGSHLATDPSVARRAFELALAADDAVAIDAGQRRLLARTDLGLDECRDVRSKTLAAHAGHADNADRQARELSGLEGWLDVEPALLEPLATYIARQRLGDDAALTAACDRLQRACTDGIGNDARDLVSTIADAARERGAPAEMRARELLLGFELDDASRERVQRRLVDLSVRAGNVGRAVELLHALVQQAAERGAADSVFAGLWQRIADLEEEEHKNPRAAADALTALLGHAPDDAIASRRLLALLLELNDDEGTATECLRRAAILPPSQERNDLLMRAADVRSRAGRLDEARAIGLRALRSPPFAQIALDRVLDLAKQTQSRRLAIRARLAASKSLRASAPADAARHAAEAGGLLAGVLRRNRLAVAAFVFADDACTRAGTSTDSHARMLVELYRALGDGAGAKRWIDRLVDHAEGKERARLLEARADVSANLLADDDGAIADRREALGIDPTYAAAARALSRQLTARGQLHDAIAVERRFIDSTASGEVRGIAFARLATTANDGHLDAALVAELCTVALTERDDIDMRRLLVAALEQLDDVGAAIAALAGLRERAPDPLERLSVGRRLAAHHRARGDVGAAIGALQAIIDDEGLDAVVLAGATAPLPADAGYDTVVVDLAHLRAGRGERALAAEAILRGLGRFPAGPALNPRHTLLEQAGTWLDDADTDADNDALADRALAVLCDADESGGLSDDGEVRRARLAEEQGQPAIACAALTSLISRGIEVSANSRRLAVAAEAAGDQRRALESWQRALAADAAAPANAVEGEGAVEAEAWIQVERLAVLLGDAATARQAREALLTKAAGDNATQAARAAACAEDALDREGNRPAAIAWLERARQFQSSPAIRSRLLELSLAELAVASTPALASQSLALLDEMVDAADVVPVAARLKRADLRLGALDVDADAGAAKTAIADILAAVDAAGAAGESIAEGAVADLLGLAVAAAPRSVALALAEAPTRLLLQDALISAGGLDDPSIEDALLLQLADAAPDVEALQRAAARRLAASAHTDEAAARLFGLARRRGDTSTNTETRVLVDDAAALAIAGGSAVLLGHLEDVRPALRRSAERRDQALAVLRDIESWDHVAVVLEDAVVATDDSAERRRLRMQLVSVLREGTDTDAAHARAAEHLGQLVDEDSTDREAWGELFECLERLGDLDALQVALGRLANVLGPTPTHLEARQLVRRRAELLLGLGRAAEAVTALEAVRLVGDDDEALRALLAKLHRAIDDGSDAGPSTIAFLQQELGASHRVADARTIVALPPELVHASAPGLRTDAHVILASTDDAGAAATAVAVSSTPLRHDEALQVAAALSRAQPARVAPFLASLAREVSAWGSTAALAITDALYGDSDVRAAGASALAEGFAAPGFMRRARTSGFTATAVDVERLGGRVRDLAAFRRAARLADRPALLAAASALGVSVAVGADVVVEMTGRATSRNAARSTAETITALARHGDPRATAWLNRVDTSGNSESTPEIALRCAALPLRGPRRAARLPLRLRLAPQLPNPATDLAAIADAAFADGNHALQIQALDGLFLTRPAAPAELVARADAAFALGADDSATFASAAAAVTIGDDAVRLRRRAIELFLRRGDQQSLGHELLALAHSAPAGAAGDVLRAEARSTAEAARLTDVVDAILGAAESQLEGVAERTAAVKDRAALRLKRKDPLGAFVALRDAAKTIGDVDAAAELRHEAWRTATAEGLTWQSIEVLGDDDTDTLARAGLLTLLGRHQEARDLCLAMTSPAAAWLLADLARLSGDAVAEEEALSRLADHGSADDGAVIRLIDASRRRGDVDDAARRALALCGRGLNGSRLTLLLDCAEGASAALRAEAAHVLLGAKDADVPVDVRLQALVAATRLAAGLDDVALRREARLTLARARDTDAGWIEHVTADLRELDEDEFTLALERQLGRPAVLRAVIATVAANADDIARLATCLSALIRTGDAARVVELLTTMSPRPWRLSEVLSGALEVTGKSRDAADVLVASIADGAPGRRALVRASELLVEAGAFGAAARALCGLTKDDIDPALLVHAKDVVTRAARDGAMGDAARLAAHIGRFSTDDTFVALALGLADAAGGDTALTIASERLRRRDVRALALLAHHSLVDSDAQGYFGAWHALRSRVRSFAPHAPDGFERIAAIAASRDVELPPLPPPATTLMQQARQGSRRSRQQAWKALAAEVAATDELASARLLIRAGVPMAEAPLEVRLAVDPALADDAVRAAAIAAQLALVAEARRPGVVEAFDAASVRGATTARQRLAVDALAARQRSPLVVALDHLAVGEAVDVTALVKGLGRHPAPAARTQAATIARMVGRDDVAAAIDPAAISQGTVNETATLSAMRTVDDNDDSGGLRALGRLRLSQLAGPRTDVEERIAAIATRLGRTDLLAESLMRLARLQSAKDRRAAVLVRHAQVVLTTDIAAAERSARMAFALDPSPATSALMTTIAEATDDAAALERALIAQTEAAADDDEKTALVVRRATLLAHRMLRPEDAIVLIDDRLAEAPSGTLQEEKAAILERLLSQPRDAALSLLAAIDIDGDIMPVAKRSQLRRRAAALLEREASEDSIALAVTALCESAADGDPAALDDAETLARQGAPGEPLARVLDLRLAQIEDLSARRVLVLERARLLHDIDDAMGAISLLEAQAVADPIDLGARLALAEWYLKDRRILDAALAFESAARIPGLPTAGFGPPAREAASLLGALGDLERAGPLAEMAVQAGVSDLEVLSVAEAWNRLHERWGAVDELLGRELEHIADARREAHVWMERASVRHTHLADEAGAKKALGQVLALVPDHPRALQMMRDDAERSDTWGALRMALLRAVDVCTDPRQQATWLREIAAIDGEHLGDKKAAEASVERALSLDSDNVESLILKATLMVKAGRVDGVSAIMDRIENLSQEHGHAELPGLLHLVRGDALVVAGDRTAAQAAFRLATEDPETSARAWDRLIDMDDGTAAALPLLDEARRSTLDSKRRLTLWRKELRLKLKLGDDGADAAAQVLGLAPDDNDALAVLKDAYGRRRKQRDLLPFVTAHARAVDDPLERAARLANVATFCIDELGQESSARAFFEEALGLDPAQPTALIRLADIAWASRDDERALDLLDRIGPEQWLATPGDDGAVRTVVELYLRRARCAWALGHKDVRERLRLVLRVDAKHIAALELLAKVALDADDDDGAELALESLGNAIQAGDDPVRLASVLVDLAQLRMRRGKPQDALAAAERAFDLNPTNRSILETVAAVREAANRYVDAAEAWRRLAALRSGPERIAALEHRVDLLQKADRTKETIDAWLDLYAETGDPRHKVAAADLARVSGQPDLLTRTGATVETAAFDSFIPDMTQTEAMPVAPGSGGALVIQLRANMDAGDHARALKLALAAREVQPLDAESARLGIDAARLLGKNLEQVELAESRLQAATHPGEIRDVALDAARVARDLLHDDDRAAALLYQAHQADAEDVEVRLELTELYARIPRLSSHAVTGILQLLRRTPADPRVFALAAELAESQGQGERAQAMRGVQAILAGTGVPQELMAGRWADERMTSGIMPIDRESIATRLAPTGWGGPLQQLINLLGVHLEAALGSPPPPTGSKPLVQASPRSAGMMERIDRLLPGRAVQVVMADVDRPAVCAGGTPIVVVPRDVLVHDAALHATIARGVAVARMGAMLSELVRPGSEGDLLDLLKAGLLGVGSKDARTETLTARLKEEERKAAVALATQVFAGPGPVDVAGTLQLMARACDRFVLVATGSPIAALQASALPSLVKEPPQRAMMLVQGSVRALELCAFAARDNAWLLRRQHLLSG